MTSQGLGFLVVVATGLVSAALTAVARRYTVRRLMIDVPQRRSSHREPTPRGGGIAIAITTLIGIGLWGLLGWIPPRTTAAFLGGGGLVAGVGWLEDVKGVTRTVRATVHVAAAGWAVFWLAGLPHLDVGGHTVTLGAAGTVLAVLGIVWAINAYNFMDGIDGLAGSEAVAVGVIGGGLLGLSGSSLALVPLLIAAASVGFLLWNWSPARIFMGDVGSGLLGYLLACVALASENTMSVPLLVWLLLLGVFAFDATVTLVRRALGGERWYEAHRKHAYQRLVLAGWSHARVCEVVLVMNLLLGGLGAVGSADPRMLLPCLSGGALLLIGCYVLVERLRPFPRALEPDRR